MLYFNDCVQQPTEIYEFLLIIGNAAVLMTSFTIASPANSNKFRFLTTSQTSCMWDNFIATLLHTFPNSVQQSKIVEITPYFSGIQRRDACRIVTRLKRLALGNQAYFSAFYDYLCNYWFSICYFEFEWQLRFRRKEEWRRVCWVHVRPGGPT